MIQGFDTVEKNKNKNNKVSSSKGSRSGNKVDLSNENKSESIV